MSRKLNYIIIRGKVIRKLTTKKSKYFFIASNYRQLSFYSKRINYKIIYGFLSAEGPKARDNKTGINIFPFSICKKMSVIRYDTRFYRLYNTADINRYRSPTELDL